MLLDQDWSGGTTWNVVVAYIVGIERESLGEGSQNQTVVGDRLAH